MKQKLSEEFEALSKVSKQQFDKLKQSKDKRWLLLIPVLIPLFFNPLLLIGGICLGIFIYLQFKDSKN